MRRFIFLFFSILFASVNSLGQNIEPENGVHDPHNTLYALINVKIVVSADKTIERGTVLVRNGIIENVGLAVIPPRESVKIDLKGFTLYPSFIDIYSAEGMPANKPERRDFSPQLSTLKEGPFYWNQAIHPEVDAYELYSTKNFKSKEEYIKQGFGVISTHSADGILRGTSTLITLGDDKSNVIIAKSANHYSFSKGSSRQSYPSSQMGSIALIRQFFYDAKWYDLIEEPQKQNISLLRGIENLQLPQIFGVSEKLEILRAFALASEFNLNLIAKGGGDEYERVKDIKATGMDLIIPVNFPMPFDMSDPYAARFVTLGDLKNWELKPYNPYILYKNGIRFSLTMSDLKKKKDFLKNVKTSIKHGLPKNEALRALTENPAKMLKVDDKLGTIENGKMANFLVVKGDLFQNGEIYENWINGDRKRFKDVDLKDIRGEYGLNINNIIYELIIKGTMEKPKASLISYKVSESETGTAKVDTMKVPVDFTYEGLQVSMMFELSDGLNDGLVQLNGSFHDGLGIIDGNGQVGNGNWIKWSAIRSEKHKEKKKDKAIEIDTSAINQTSYPNMEYGFDTLPEAKTYYIKNATIWTNEEDGILENASLLIRNGKIVSINGGTASGAITIDAEGKHVTCGIIDEHSHISISKGVNEGGQAISAEVSIADVVRSDDINMYRQLAGGVTTSQLLHGSANPIGGQSALIKLKWGFTPEEMLVDSADGFIKFALGENVKQSNWGDFNTVRYPQTRMGVEQLFYDAFIRAKEYKKSWEDYYNLPNNKKKKTIAPRRDLELDALAEILDKKRFITCHSYIQSEINMLMSVGDSMGFTINTFTHILEGYKVADKMKEHGAGASTFADWWAYKYEVNEAIPYNAAILNEMGIVTAINSDDAEMGRRLNQEAAKAVKYGGVSQEDAWKMVTLNPAKLLHIDDRMGSIKVGKDADIVIWSDNPLSINAKVEQTFIDGILFYDWRKSLQLYDRDQKERKRIIKLMLKAKNGGAATKAPLMRRQPHYHCDSVGHNE